MSTFRKSALDRLSSPDQLDHLLKVTSPTGWAALSGLGAVILTALAWGFLGSIPEMAIGMGMLIKSGGVSEIVATGSGQLEELRVGIGDTVSSGDVVATIAQDELKIQIEEAETRVEQARAEYEDARTYLEAQRRFHESDSAQKRANYEARIAAMEEQVTLLEQRMTSEEDLFADGLVTKATLLRTQQMLSQTRDSIATAQVQLQSLDLQQLDSDQQSRQMLARQQSTLQDLEFQLARLRARYEDNANIVSPYRGRVLEVAAEPGDRVGIGSRVLTVELASDSLMAVIYVPIAKGKLVQPGMSVQISPTNVKREEYGYMLGEVVTVAEFPTTSEGMHRRLANEAVVQQLMAGGAPVEVLVALLEDESTPSGFSWSSKAGPDLRITSGTMASGSVVVRTQRPIRLVIPKVRKTFGI